MSLNQLLVDQPGPVIAGSAVLVGEVHVGAGAILAQGLVVRAHGGAVSVQSALAGGGSRFIVEVPALSAVVGPQRSLVWHSEGGVAGGAYPKQEKELSRR